MGGLVAYESSDEEDGTPEVPATETKPQELTKEGKVDTDGESRTSAKETEEAVISQAPVEPQEQQNQQEEEQRPIIGPQMGPEAEGGPSYPPLEEDPALEEEEAAVDPAIPPGSPYSAERAALRNLTLPPVPNTEIPPSPPGSPPPGTNRKFAQFLELKKKGVHFNSKLAGSPALQNPALADKLLAFVDAGSREAQYATVLAPDLWDPAAFPRCAFKEQLRAAQTETAQARARGRGAAVDFVPAGEAGSGAGAVNAASEGSVAAAAAGTGTGKRKTRFDKRSGS
ncbi:hypothetical protein DL771_001992 [Monosporascus sp. 5C6A]|nr:hypothetical protein DL771_001992 [Monosporascus sp. 5C6A]